MHIKRKAVFLDRDGTINILAPGDYIFHPDRFRIYAGAAKAIRALNRLGFLVIVISNQGGIIAKGKATKKRVEEIHALMIRRLSRRGAKIDAIYYCPHHPKGVVKEHAIECRCRKPNPGMILGALKEFTIDRQKSFLVGDTTGDILAGRRARVRTILVQTGYGGRDMKHRVRPDFTARDLLSAVAVIRKHGEK